MIKKITQYVFACLLFSISQITPAQSLNYIPDKDLVTINCNGTNTTCLGNFTIKDTIWWAGIYAKGAYYSTNKEQLMALLYQGFIQNYIDINSKYEFQGYRDCHFIDDRNRYYACTPYGQYPYRDPEHPEITLYADFEMTGSMQTHIVFDPINCPSDGVYVPGKGCTTNNYTSSSSGITYKTDRNLPISLTYCLPCSLKELGDYAPPVSLMSPKRGDPIDVMSHAVVEQKTDINFPILFQRSYISKRTNISTLGLGWKHNFDKKLSITTATSDGESYAAVLQFSEDNDEEIFFSRSSANSNFNLIFADQTGFSVVLVGNNYALQMPNGNSEIYDSNGNLIQINYVNGSIYTIERNISGQLSKITNQYGQWLSFIYSNNLLSQVTISNGDVIHYNYSGNNLLSAQLNNTPFMTYGYINGKLTSITDEMNNPYSSFTYHATTGDAIQNARMLGTTKIEQHDITYANSATTETQPNGNNVSYSFATYMNQTKLTSFSEANHTYSLTYDTNGNIKSYNNVNSGSYVYNYNTNTGLISSVQNPLGNTMTVTWDNNARVPLTLTEPGGGGTKTTTFTYDQYRNIASKTISGLGGSRTWAYTYDNNGHLMSQTNPDGTSLTYTYYGMNDSLNLRGLLKTITNGINQTLTINNYDERGNPTSVTNFNNVTKTMTYDVKGRLLTETIGQATNTYVYNDAGDLTQVSLATGYILNMTYDLAHRLTNMSDNNGGSTTLTLDDTTSQVTSQQVNQNNVLVATRNKIIDKIGRMTKFWHSNSNVAAFYTYKTDDTISPYTDENGISSNANTDKIMRETYVSTPSYHANYILDAAGNKTKTTINSYQVTNMTYNVFDEMTQLVSLDTGTSNFNVDVNNRQLVKIDNAGTTHTTQYDLGNRITSVSHINGTTSLNESVTYNTNGFVDTITDNSGSTSYIYDSLGRVTQKIQHIGTKSFTVNYSYNNVGQLLTTTYPSGLIVNYNYVNGLLNNISTSGVKTKTLVSDITYQSLERKPVSWKLGNNQVNMNYSVDELITGFNDNLMNQVITTDSIGLIISITDSLNSFTLTSGYSNDYQLKNGAINGNSIFYYYDQNSNAGTKQDGTSNATLTLTYTGQSNKLNMIVKNSVYKNVVSDNNGNITSDNHGAYTYDLKNNMASASITSPTTSSGMYSYNALNQRVSKTVNGITTYFLYNESKKLIGEYDDNGNVIAEHIYFNDRPVGFYQNNNMFIVHTDYLSTPRIVTDENNNVVWKWLGTTATGSNLPSISTIEYNLRFTGQYFDKESNLHYNYFRTYNPETGRYMQSDPIGLNGGANTYNYVNSNPLNATDEFGLDPANTYVLGDRNSSSLDMKYMYAAKQNDINPPSSLVFIAHADITGIRFYKNSEFADNLDLTNKDVQDVYKLMGKDDKINLGFDSFSKLIKGLKVNKKYNKIVIYACNYGEGQQAQGLANKLNMPIEAANKYIILGNNLENKIVVKGWAQIGITPLLNMFPSLIHMNLNATEIMKVFNPIGN